MKKIPNLLSSLRLALGLGFFLFPASWRLEVIAVALLSEYFDGQIARAFDAETRLGVFLDPIADKVFVFAVLITVTWDGILAPWELAFIAARDIIVAGAVVWFFLTRQLARIGTMHVAIPGKLATALQFCALLTAAGGLHWRPLILATGAVSLVAGLDYIRRGRKPHAAAEQRDFVAIVK